MVAQDILDEHPGTTRIPSRAIKIGAEARIDLVRWQGIEAISKTRIPKSYRNPVLDQRIRTRRTKEETEILFLSKLARVVCPKVFFVDPNRCEIIMEYVEGELLRDLEIKNSITRDEKLSDVLSKIYDSIGKYAARLHGANLVHGDLTTKNVIVPRMSEGHHVPALIDFGLSFYSERIEDRAEDLHLLNQALKSSTDSSSAKAAFNLVIKGYKSEAGLKQTKQVLDTIAEIEKRGRYARVD